MQHIHKTKIFLDWMGFTNQLYTIVANILYCIKEKKRILILDDFQKEINSGLTISIREILNLDLMNLYFNDKYNLIILDKNITFKVISIEYGLKSKKINITEELLKLSCIENNKFTISKNINLNNIKGDILFGEKKKIFITYSVNGIILNDEYDELHSHLLEDVIYDFNINKISFINGWGINPDNEKYYRYILKKFYYKNNFEKLVLKYMINNFDITNDKINVFHIRLEDDAIEYWSKLNNLSENDFKKKLEDKYIQLIEKYIDRSEKNIILSYSLDNNVIQYMLNNGYNVNFIPKNKELGREINALNDFLISKFCNNIFIGNYNPNFLNEKCSTFSYYISKTINANVKQLLLDIQFINTPESIHYNIIYNI